LSSAPPLLRAVVFAYSEMGAMGLETLLELGAEIPLVVTHPDDPDEKSWFRSVGALAETASIPVFRSKGPRAAGCAEAVREARPEFLFSFYYRRLIPPEILTLAPRGAFNLHGSLLPRFRGRAPVNWALIEGAEKTGVTLHVMDADVDHGDIVGRKEVPIAPRETALSLSRKLVEAGRALLVETVPAIARGEEKRVPQDHAGATVYGGRRPEDGRIDWSQSAIEIERLVRAVADPWPGAFGYLGPRKLVVWEAWPEEGAGSLCPGAIRMDRETRTVRIETGQGCLRLDRIQLEGEPTGTAWNVLRDRVEEGGRLT
jgi:UDP-4-amino-4-deoxy-L-arabinose formyltransferase/UDP-glucuronic acid dehydrogenase (UDP-4-keto-hexauronic acid decarboxylating)